MARKQNKGRRDNRTGSIFKDGTGYRAQVPLGIDAKTGKPIIRKTRTKTHEEAIAALLKMQAEAHKGTLAPPTNSNLESFLNFWLENRVKLTCAPKTHEQYKWVIDYHILPTLGKKRLEAVTRQDIQALIRNLANIPAVPRTKDAKKAKPRTIGRRTLEVVRNVLRAAYNDAIKNGLVGFNPAATVDLPAAEQKRPIFLSPEEAARLSRALADSPIAPLVRFMLATGTRSGEARGLRWKDVDLTNKRVFISGQLQWSKGKLTRTDNTKTHLDRTLPIAEWVADELRGLAARQMVEQSADPEGIVFLNAEGNRIDDRYLNRQLEKACLEAKIQPISSHKLRHTAATIAMDKTGDLHAVQKMLGHKKVGLTADLYAHADTRRIRPASDALGKALSDAFAASPEAQDG